MKTLGVITLFLLAIIISVGVSVYIIRQEQPKNNTQRFQVVFGEILHDAVEPSDEPGISTVLKKTEPICFKYDTQTGETWRYVSSFYKDPNQLVTTLGFERVYEDSYPHDIYEVTKRETPQLVPDGTAKPKRTINDLRRGFEK